MGKIISLAVGMFLVFAFPALAISAEEKALEFSTSVGYFSKYVGPFGPTYYDQGVIQAEAGVVHPSGFYVAVWGSFSPDGGWNNDFGDEIDFNAGVAKTMGPVEIDLGGVYYDNLKVGTFDEEDIWGLTLKVSVPEVFGRFIVIPFLNIELDFPYEDGGLLYQAGIKHPFGWIGAGDIVFFANVFEAEILINGHGEGFGLDAELVSSARASLSANFDFGQFKLSPGFHYQVGFGGDDGMAEDNVFWWGLSATMTF